MSRLKIEMPEKLIATFRIPVRIGDINYGNHIGNDSFVAILHEARMQWLKQFHFTELNIAGIGLIMSDISIEFKNEGLYGDVMDVKIFVGEITSVSFELFYQINTARESKDMLLCKAKTSMVCFDYKIKKVREIPVALMALLA